MKSLLIRVFDNKKLVSTLAAFLLSVGMMTLFWLPIPLWTSVALILGGTLAVLAFFYPFWGLCIFVFLIPLEEAFLITEKLTFLKLLGLFIFFAWLARILVRRQYNLAFPRPFLLAFLLFGLWGLASVLWAQDTVAALWRWLTMLLMIGFFFIVSQIVTSWGKLHWLIISNVVGALVAAGLGLYNWLRADPSSQWRISAFIDLEKGQYVQSPAHYGILLALGIFYLLIAFLCEKGLGKKIIYLVGFASLLLAALASGTRSFLVSFSVALVALAWHLWRARAGRILALGGIGAGVILAIVTAVMPSYFFSRVESLWTTLGDRGSGRFDIWKVFLVEIAENPLVGVGLANGGVRYDEHRTIAVDRYGFLLLHPEAWKSGRDPHSIYLESWAELGLVGFVLLIWIIISLAKQIYKSVKLAPLYSWEWQVGLVIALNFLALLVTGITEPSLYRKYLWLGFALIQAYARLIGARGLKR
jgi:O-antigen ligase